ncbi:MAG: hypothetical protein WCX23_02755 [Candidatus Paceibacterota bacterium]|jgi:uncharacterized membrane protein
MKAFEFYFNPGTKKELAFETFCFEPENPQEKALGSLYLAGSITGKEDNGDKLLSELATLIKTQYYQPANESPESALKEVLNQANKLLTGLDSKDRQISFFVLSFKEGEINFSIFGEEIKIVFLQKGKISKVNKAAKKEPFVFKNIMSGNLGIKDSGLILSSDILDFFLEKNILEKIISEKDSKQIERILSKFKKETKALSGFCLLLQSEAKSSPKKNAPDKKWRNTAAKIISFAGSLRFKKSLPSLSFNLKKPSFPQKISLKALFGSLKNQKLPAIAFWNNWKKRDVFSVILLLLILLAGFFMSQEGKKKEMDSALEEIRQVEQLVSQANVLIGQKKEQEANLILQQAFDQISLKIKKSKAAEEEAESLKGQIREKLYAINKVQINTPFETVLKLSKDKTDLIPNNILCQGEKFYLFNSMSGKLLVYDSEDRSGETFSSETNLRFGKIFGEDQIVFINSRNQVFLFKEEGFQELGTLVLPSSGTQFQSFEVFKNNLYFLSYDSEEEAFSKEIIKYSYSGDYQWEDPQVWLKKTSKDSISISADGLVWILNSDGSVRSYYTGLFQNEIKLKIFPYLKNITKILAPSNLARLYLLETNQKRIIILDKNGEIIKQIQNDLWTDLLDFAISPDGKSIYLLNEASILQVKI